LTVKGNMTRDYNKQSRDDYDQSFRNNSSRRDGEERSSRPNRPRLSREMVDRAWENGAPRIHPDYHPRSSNGPSSRNNWRGNQYTDNSSRRSYDHRQSDGQRQGTASPQYNGRRSGDKPNTSGQSYEPYNNDRSEQRPGQRYGQQNRSGQYSGNRNGHQSNYSGPRSERRFDDQNNRYGHQGDRYSHQNNRSEQYPGNRNGQQDNRNDRYGNQNGSYRSQGSPRFNRAGQEPGYSPRRPDNAGNAQGHQTGGNRGHFGSNSRYPNRYQSDERNQSGRSFSQEQRPYGSRRFDHQDGQRRPQERRYQSPAEQFEGDYEHFGLNEERGSDRSFTRHHDSDNRNRYPEQEERHVTKMPDGRVIKGSRPEQRKKAQFWTDVNHDTDELIEQIQPVEKPEPARARDTEQQPSSQILPFKTTKNEASKKGGQRKPASAGRRAKATKAVEKKPRSTGPKPSQRGFKWPAQ